MPENSELPDPAGQIERLQGKYEKHQTAVDRVMNVHDTIGSEAGPKRFDLTKITDPEKLISTQAEARSVKLQLANRSLEVLVEQEVMLKDLLDMATNAEADYRKAEENYLAGNATPEEDEQFDMAYIAVKEARDRINAYLTPPKKADKEQPIPNADMSKNSEVNVDDELEPESTKDEEIATESDESETESASETETEPENVFSLTVADKKDIEYRPVHVRLPRKFVDFASWASRRRLDPTPISLQEQNFQKKVNSIRSGELPVPTLPDFVSANDRGDTESLVENSQTVLEALISDKIVKPDGTINQAPGLPAILAKDINNLIAVAGSENVKNALDSLPTLEFAILCEGMSVHMKEKLGNPDLDICSANVMAAYIRNSVFDRLVDERDEVIDKEKQDPNTVIHERFHERDTELPVEAEEIMDVVFERDVREPGFSSALIDSLLDNSRSKSSNPETRTAIVMYGFKRLINFFDDADRLGELKSFFSSNAATEELANQCARRIGQLGGRQNTDRYDPIYEDDYSFDNDREEELSEVRS